MKKKLSKKKILRQALKMADIDGLETLSMRKLAKKLKVEPMSLYHHFKNKNELLGQLIGFVFSEMGWPDQEDQLLKTPWQEAMRLRAEKFRQTLQRHHWAINLLDSTTNLSTDALIHHNSVLAVLCNAGFSIEDAAHAFALLDSYIYGFVVQERTIPVKEGQDIQKEFGPMMTDQFEIQFPYLFKLSQHYVMKDDYSFSNEFSIGLGLIIQSLEKQLAQGKQQ